ncbi:MAG: hypothetical protein HP496_17525, partial [Nitrospira sp.]|nr:hypothetical protein [Nitrospira sp.]
KDGTTSVGAVCWPSYIGTRKVPLEQFLWETIALCPPVADRMANAKLLGQAYAAANYSYRRTTMSGDGYIMVGDAFAFIDPVFSSGVHLALNSATLGADVVDAHLRTSPDYGFRLKEFERLGVKTYSWFIYHFTQPAFRHLFMSEGSIFKMEEAVLSVLAGDAFGKSPTRIAVLVQNRVLSRLSVQLQRELGCIPAPCRRRAGNGDRGKGLCRASSAVTRPERRNCEIDNSSTIDQSGPAECRSSYQAGCTVSPSC